MRLWNIRNPCDVCVTFSPPNRTGLALRLFSPRPLLLAPRVGTPTKSPFGYPAGEAVSFLTHTQILTASTPLSLRICARRVAEMHGLRRLPCSQSSGSAE